MEGGQRPLELILARNLLASLSTPAFLVDRAGEIAFYNEAAGALLGRRYEDAGPMQATEWAQQYGPYDRKGRPIPFEKLDLTEALMGNRPAHSSFCIRTLDGETHEIEASGLPIMGIGGYRGALVVFWPISQNGKRKR
jgi:PAS domain-containing protein